MSGSCQNQHWGRRFAARSGKLVASVGRFQNQHWGRSFAATSGKIVALVGRFQIDNLDLFESGLRKNDHDNCCKAVFCHDERSCCCSRFGVVA